MPVRLYGWLVLSEQYRYIACPLFVGWLSVYSVAFPIPKCISRSPCSSLNALVSSNSIITPVLSASRRIDFWSVATVQSLPTCTSLMWPPYMLAACDLLSPRRVCRYSNSTFSESVKLYANRSTITSGWLSRWTLRGVSMSALCALFLVYSGSSYNPAVCCSSVCSCRVCSNSAFTPLYLDLVTPMLT